MASKLATSTMMPSPVSWNLQIRNDEDHSDHGHKRRQVLVAVLRQKEIRLGLQPVLAAHFPDGRQNEKRDHVGQRQVRQNVQRRPPREYAQPLAPRNENVV